MYKKKRFGQHFLVDKNILAKIADSLTLKNVAYQQVLEIGPGDGKLTDFLIKDKDIELFLIEIDRDLVLLLNNSFPEIQEKIILADFLSFPFHEKFKSPIAIIGNFPYNISSQILVKIIENRTLIPEVVGMFQQEVAERITATPGKKSYGRLTILVQAFYKTEYLFTVSKNVFRPVPKVESAVIRMIRIDDRILDIDENLFFKIVKAAFGHRRKQLRNALAEFEPHFHKLEEGFLTKRAEQLSLEDYFHLTKIFSEK